MELPTYLQIEPVGQCNLRCQMCAIQFRQDGPPYGPLAFMAFLIIACPLTLAGVVFFLLTLLRKDTPER